MIALELKAEGLDARSMACGSYVPIIRNNCKVHLQHDLVITSWPIIHFGLRVFASSAGPDAWHQVQWLGRRPVQPKSSRRQNGQEESVIS